MKKIITLAVIGLFFITCSNDDNSSSSNLPEKPQAKAEFDNSNFGIYKGVFTGSSGVIFVNIKNDGKISATLLLDGITYEFSTTENITQNQAIEGLTFTSGKLSFVFHVKASGLEPLITNIDISGHPNSFILIMKEVSTAIVKCYEGTYSGTDSGIFNVVISDNFLSGLAKSNDESDGIFIVPIAGNTTGNIIDASTQEVIIKGSINNYNLNGTWLNSKDSSEKGNWIGYRKL